MTLANLSYEANLFGAVADDSEEYLQPAGEVADRVVSQWMMDHSSIPGELSNVQPVLHSRALEHVHANNSTDLTRAIRRLQPAGNKLPAKGVNHQSAIKSLFGTLAIWRERARGRRELRSLDNRMLRDIGITSDDAAREFHKRAWVP